jgi:septum formation protein
MTHPLILGSASPRRRELLAQVFPRFAVLAADLDEGQFPDEPSSLYHARITMAKLTAVCAAARSSGQGGALVLAADTIVVVGDRVMGKPLGAEDARRTLAGLAGTEHEVRTRFLVARAADDAVLHAQTVTTTVWFRALEADEIDAYVATGEPMDKAGAYGIQGGAASFVRAIEGSYTNVVGLPLAEVVTALRPLLRGA